ncbi:hypothetical protein [Streptomyces decoyicus]
MTDTFFGVPISGDITQGSSRVEQKPIEELAPLFQAVMDDPSIVEFGWQQYTPYFNDGDTCEFSVHGLWVKTTAEQELEEEGTEEFGHWDLEAEWGHPSLGKRNYEWVGEWPDRKRIDLGYEGPDEARYDRVQALDSALQGAHFENALLAKFGDHARVTVQKDGIDVEFYSHD